MTNVIDIIVPVYRGLSETRTCLESVLQAPTRQRFELIVINDSSPEPALVSYLSELASSSRITLFHNSENLGFVQTVNRGMNVHADRDVVLLNSDTEVSNDWLDRIHVCATSHARVGTVTPFSNNATICSYPRFCENTPWPPDQTLGDWDDLFRTVNAKIVVDIPTAVGFCMYIRRACLYDVGVFDHQTFGRGYGEEGDFCMRATKRRWRHVLCADTFVRHVGRTSFGIAADELLRRSAETLRRLHPQYHKMVARHVAVDPARPLRLAVDLRRLQLSGRPKILFVTHDFGGGTEKHVRELMHFLSGRADVLTLRSRGLSRIDLEWPRPGEGFSLHFYLPVEYGKLLSTLRAIGVERAHFHHTLDLNPSAWHIPADLGIPYDYTVHDFLPICPRINLHRPPTGYCGEPDEAGCNECLRADLPHRQEDIRDWRSRYGAHLRRADRVLVPSRDAADRLRRHFPTARVLIAPHPDGEDDHGYPPPFPRSLDPGAPLTIAVLGGLDAKKGGGCPRRLCSRRQATRTLAGVPSRWLLLARG